MFSFAFSRHQSMAGASEKGAPEAPPIINRDADPSVDTKEHQTEVCVEKESS